METRQMSSVSGLANTLFDRFDRNKDGFIDLRPDAKGRIEGSRNGGGDRTFVFLSTSDYNRDYKLDRFEMSAGVARQLDRNKDSTISLKERALAWFRFKF
jgi:hypothetical protein